MGGGKIIFTSTAKTLKDLQRSWRRSYVNWLFGCVFIYLLVRFIGCVCRFVGCVTAVYIEGLT